MAAEKDDEATAFEDSSPAVTIYVWTRVNRRANGSSVGAENAENSISPEETIPRRFVDLNQVWGSCSMLDSAEQNNIAAQRATRKNELLTIT